MAKLDLGLVSVLVGIGVVSLWLRGFDGLAMMTFSTLAPMFVCRLLILTPLQPLERWFVERKSIRGYATFLLSLYLSLAAPILLLSEGLLEPKLEVPLALRCLGLCVASIGAILVVWSILTLGFVEIARIREVFGLSRRLVVRGPYKFVRHPLYLGEVMWILGIFALMGSIPLFFFLLCWLPGLVYIVSKEEEKLREDFEEYEAYCRRVGFFPKLWRK